MNAPNQIDIILSNELALDDDGWAVIAPYGEHPKKRVAIVDGRPVEQTFIQVLDNDSARRLMSSDNSLFTRFKRAVVGLSVFKGHPDLREHAPETMESNAPRVKLGVVNKIRQTARGIEARFVLDPDGKRAVENGCKYPSALWLVQPCGERVLADGQQAALCRPFKLLSVGLTSHPNISGVESLANARGAGSEIPPAAEVPPQIKEPTMNKIIGWLMGQGVVLANTADPTEEQVLDALQEHLDAKAGVIQVLGNEKTNLAGEMTALKSRVAALANEKSGLAETLGAVEKTIKTERSGRAAAVVDLAIGQGRLAVADRFTRIQALENARTESDFTSESERLFKSAKIIRLPRDTASGKVLANATDDDPRDMFCAAVAKHMKDTGDNDPIKAHKAVAKANPALADALAKRGEKINAGEEGPC